MAAACVDRWSNVLVSDDLHEGTNVDNNFPRCFNHFVNVGLVMVDVSVWARSPFTGVVRASILVNVDKILLCLSMDVSVLPDASETLGNV